MSLERIHDVSIIICRSTLETALELSRRGSTETLFSLQPQPIGIARPSFQSTSKALREQIREDATTTTQRSLGPRYAVVDHRRRCVSYAADAVGAPRH